MRRRAFALSLLLLVACSDDKPDDAGPRDASTTAPLHAEGELADGTYVGFVTALDPARFRLVFDRAELLEGDDAVQAAEADGEVVAEGGTYVDNPDDRMHRLTIDEDIVVRLLRPCCDLHVVSFEDWLAGFEPDDRTFYGTSDSRYEITITDGKVSAVDELYLP